MKKDNRKKRLCDKCKNEFWDYHKTAVCLGCLKKLRLCGGCYSTFTSCDNETCKEIYRKRINEILQEKLNGKSL